MKDWRLPDDLDSFERQLQSRPRETLPDGLRGRVMAGVEQALLRQRRESRWRWVATAAAGVCLWLNVSISASSNTVVPDIERVQPQPIQQLAREIEELAPGLSHGEAMRQAFLFQSGKRLTPCPEVSGRSTGAAIRNESPG